MKAFGRRWKRRLGRGLLYAAYLRGVGGAPQHVRDAFTQRLLPLHEEVLVRAVAVKDRRDGDGRKAARDCRWHWRTLRTGESVVFVPLRKPSSALAHKQTLNSGLLQEPHDPCRLVPAGEAVPPATWRRRNTVTCRRCTRLHTRIPPGALLNGPWHGCGAGSHRPRFKNRHYQARISAAAMLPSNAKSLRRECAHRLARQRGERAGGGWIGRSRRCGGGLRLVCSSCCRLGRHRHTTGGRPRHKGGCRTIDIRQQPGVRRPGAYHREKRDAVNKRVVGTPLPAERFSVTDYITAGCVRLRRGAAPTVTPPRYGN
jgi:hypothetical protein